MTETEALKIAVDGAPAVSGLYVSACDAMAVCTLAHGAGAGMTHPFMRAVAEGLARRRIATLLYNFPFIEAGSRRPDRPAIAQATVRAAVATAATRARGLPLFAGGKSFGGRMTSQAQTNDPAAPLAGVRGLFFLGFPLHPAKAPATERARHLAEVAVPMLFVQGTRDALADATLMRQMVDSLPGNATLYDIAEADHGMHVPKRSGRSDAEALDAALDVLADWMKRIAGSP